MPERRGEMRGGGLAVGSGPLHTDSIRRAARSVGALEELCVMASHTRLEVERRLIACVLDHPRVGVARCRERGVSLDLFDRDDFALMYAAALCCWRDGETDEACKTQVLAMARYVLRLHGFWDEAAASSERRMAWSESNLASLACRDGDVRDVCFWADELVRVARNYERARKHWRGMVGLLKDCCATGDGGW